MGKFKEVFISKVKVVFYRTTGAVKFEISGARLSSSKASRDERSWQIQSSECRCRGSYSAGLLLRGTNTDPTPCSFWVPLPNPAGKQGT